jgi:hypothetical protein
MPLWGAIGDSNHSFFTDENSYKPHDLQLGTAAETLIDVGAVERLLHVGIAYIVVKGEK